MWWWTSCQTGPVLEGGMEIMWPQVDPRAGPGQSQAPHSLVCPWNILLPTVPTVGVIFKDAALSEQCVETTWMVYVTEPPLSLYINLTFWQWVQRSSRLWAAKTNLVRKSPCLLKLSPANLEWLSLSLVSPCLPCMGPNFKFYLGNFWGSKPALKLRQVLSDSILRKKVFCSACLLSCLIPGSFNGI